MQLSEARHGQCTALAQLGSEHKKLSLRLPRCVSTGPVAVRLAEMAI